MGTLRIVNWLHRCLKNISLLVFFTWRQSRTWIVLSSALKILFRPMWLARIVYSRRRAPIMQISLMRRKASFGSCMFPQTKSLVHLVRMDISPKKLPTRRIPLTLPRRPPAIILCAPIIIPTGCPRSSPIVPIIMGHINSLRR